MYIYTRVFIPTRQHSHESDDDGGGRAVGNIISGPVKCHPVLLRP